MDEKKIEEAQDIIFEEEFNGFGTPVMFFGDEDNNEKMFYDNDVKKAIKLGAHWAIQEFLKELWHSGEKAPRKNEKCLVEVAYRINHGLQPCETRIEESSFHDFGWYDCDFKYLSRDYNIVRWLYIDDLLQKQEGGNEK